jgi:succinate-semialdehyde dehydrogenase / glutarate-semialdehyde dehydrogenase
MTIATINPTTGNLEKTFDPHDQSGIEQRIALAAAGAAEMRATTSAQRTAWMLATAEILESEVDEVARVLTTEMGKPLAQSQAEALKCVKLMRFYAERAQGFLAPEKLENPSRVGATEAWTQYEPLGVVLAVMPWNYPLFQVMRFAAPALMAGNSGLLKHASNVPQSALYLDTLFERGGFPRGAFSTLLISSSAVAAVVSDRRVKAVTLTGSELAGREVAATAGRELKKAVLELGGSDPFIVMPSAHLSKAVDTAVAARIQNNGQSCIAAKRFIVHADVYDQFASLFAEQLSALVIGDPLEQMTQVGPLATEAGRDELAELVADAVRQGATVLTGGRAPARPGWFYEPTLLSDLRDDMRIVLEEAFGPVASLYRVESREEALQVANQTAFGLGAAVWTTDADDRQYFVDAIDAGAVFINGMTTSYPELPFGGIKDSGYGRELAAAGIREFCNLKTVWMA